MPYDQKLDQRISNAVSGWQTTRRKMFGGTCQMLNGNMLCGVYKDFLILRLGEDAAAKALSQPHVMPFDVTGRPMKGWVMVEDQALAGKRLQAWLDRAYAFVSTLPSK